MENKNTSWGQVSSWYGDVIGDNDSYQKQVILPNLQRILDLKKTDSILELGCGNGFFCHDFSKYSKESLGVDIGDELIADAIKRAYPNEKYLVADATKPLNLKKKFSKIFFVLSLQNMKNFYEAIKNAGNLLEEKGKLVIVLNHPAFRIHKKSYWEYDEKKKVQFRKLSGYMSSFESEVIMNPGGGEKIKTYSFHRPLQEYFKALSKSGLGVVRLEEWISHKKSEKGPQQIAEDKARKEFPMFLVLECQKI